MSAEAPPHSYEVPQLSRIRRRLVAVGLAALAMVALAVTSSLYELSHERQARQRYEANLGVTHLAFDAESLAARMRGLSELTRQHPGAGEAGIRMTLRAAVRTLDVDRAEWERRRADLLHADLPESTHADMAQAAQALGNLRQIMGWRTPEDAAGSEPVAVAGTEDVEQAYVAAIESAQALVLASVRAGGERAVLGSYTATDLAAALVIGASVLALVLGGALMALIGRAQRENRTALDIMGELLRTDPLTGATNRRGLDETLPVEMARARRSMLPLTVVMIDLDYFKRYNSRRGHAGGDSLLRTAAQSWRRQLRPSDMLVRYGGEEFTLVLPACDAEQACQLVARMRPLMPDNQTFSAGVATWDYQESGDDLIRRADNVLMLAKKNGRNRTMVSGQEDQIALPLVSA